MAGRLNHQHAAYAWRCEQEHHRAQAIEKVNRYYDRWGQVTSRFENWTNPAYYDKATKMLEQRKCQEEKEKELEERRNKLRQLFEEEGSIYDMELGRKRRPRAETSDLRTLELINQTIKDREQLKRKLELEAKLYGRWRHGVDDEKLLYQSKTDNEVLAKLNWLDKQIEQQKLREEQEALAAERQLQLQQEISRTEETQKERQLIREQEIKEIRALQESHVSELKQRQEQAERLKQEEQHFRLFLSELEKEKQLLEESTALILQPDTNMAFNLKKIKIYIRSRNEAYRKQISLCVNLLERMAKYAVKTEQLQELLDKCKYQLETDTMMASQIDTMYESEAKSKLQQLEENWREEHLQRFSDVNRFIEQEECLFGNMLCENMAEQESVMALRATHLAGIEQTTKQLEQLNKEQKLSSPHFFTESTETPSGDNPASYKTQMKGTCSSQTSLSEEHDMVPKISDSFTNLNLDVWKDMPSVHEDIDSSTLNNTRSMNVVKPQTVVPPKFARKRVVWT